MKTPRIRRLKPPDHPLRHSSIYPRSAMRRSQHPQIGTLPDMKAVVITRLGGPDVLQVKDAAEPTPSENQDLVRVQTGGVNFADIRATSGITRAPELDSRDWHGFSFGDYDGDGNLDLYIAEGAKGQAGRGD